MDQLRDPAKNKLYRIAVDFSRINGLTAFTAQLHDQTHNIQCEHAGGGGRVQVERDGESAVCFGWLLPETDTES